MMNNRLFPGRSAFTMVEIVVSVMIFSLCIAGLLATISSMNRPAVESFEEVQAVYVAKQLLENLKMHVDAGTWNDGSSPLAVTTTPKVSTVNYQGINFTVSYTVTADAAGGRWVNATVSWN